MSSASRRSPPGLLETVGWPRLLFLAYFLFATVSLLLFPQLASVYLFDGPNLIGLQWAVIALTALVAWPALFTAALGFARSGSEVPPSARTLAVLALIAGLAGFVAGLVTLPMAFPAYEGGFLYSYEWEYLLVYGVFPYVPTVFASAVASHAALAILASRVCSDDGAWRRLRAGAAVLLVIALASLAAQLTGVLDGWVWGLVCLTSPGYLLAASGAWREARARTSGAPWPGPARPSQGPWP